MDSMKHITVMILALGLMGLLGIIVVDEFMMAAEHGGEFDEGILALLNNALVGVVGIVAGYVTGSKGCTCK
jgi:hypothetical protein|tara:strand:+ start:943 stop:1155 length:213 start_codon:yes stop_codon:yes gene_type:complete